MNVPGVPLVWRVEKVKKCVQVWRHLRTPPDIIFLGDIDPVGLGRPQKSQEGNDRWQSKYLGGALAQAPSILLIYPSLVGPPVFLGGSPTVGCPPDLHRGSALRPRSVRVPPPFARSAAGSVRSVHRRLQLLQQVAQETVFRGERSGGEEDEEETWLLEMVFWLISFIGDRLSKTKR